MALTTIVAYDICDNARRAKVAAMLQAHGDRIQRSVFVLVIEPTDLDELSTRVAGTVDLDHDSVYTFRQCAGCWESLGVMGQAHPPTPELYWAVW